MQLQGSDDSLASTVGLESTPGEIMRAAVQVSREILAADSTFAAVGTGGSDYPITIMDGIRDPRFGAINVHAGAGLGGQVLLRGRPLSISDYAHDPTISRDFVHVVSDIEGLGGMACVPLAGPAGIEALLYVASRVTEAPGDVAISALARVASYAELGLQHLAARKREVELQLLRERQRLAIELHDSVAQMLFSIGVAAHYSRRQGDPESLLAAMADIEATAADARRELRQTLEQISRDDEGIAFEARLEGEVRLFERRHGCEVRITRHGVPRALPEPVESLVLDTVIEGLRNDVKHAHAQLAVAHLGYGPSSVTLTLHAQHTSPSASCSRAWPASGAGAGLSILRRRATQLGGALELESQPDGLKVLRLELPTMICSPSP
jgi:signal transduction histidine kinase